MINFGVQVARSLTPLSGGPQSRSLANLIIVSLIMGLAIYIKIYLLTNFRIPIISPAPARRIGIPVVADNKTVIKPNSKNVRAVSLVHFTSKLIPPFPEQRSKA